MPKNEIDILLSIEDKATKGLDRLEKKTKKLESSFKLSALNINASLDLVQKAIRGISVAFDFIERGARLKQQEEAFRSLARSAGISADNLVKSMRDMAGGTISAADAISGATKAMVLGLNPDQLPKLMGIARSAARAFGQDVGFMFDSLTLGIGRQSRQLLDNLGIIVDAESAYRVYAESMGIVGRSLTDAEKKQAFYNAAVKAGEEQSKKIGAESRTQAENIDVLKAAWDDLSKELSEFLNESPVVRSAIISIAEASETLVEKLKTLIEGFAEPTQLEKLKSELKEVQEALLLAENEAAFKNSIAEYFSFASAAAEIANKNLEELQIKESLLKEAIDLTVQSETERLLALQLVGNELAGMAAVIQERAEIEAQAQELMAQKTQERIALIAAEAEALRKLQNAALVFSVIDKKLQEEKIKNQKRVTDQTKRSLAIASSEFKAAAIAYRVIAMGEAIMNTAKGVTLALASYPPPLNFAWAAAVGAAGAAEVATIASQGFAEGTDTVPSMLTPGEMVVPRSFASAIREGRLTLGGPEGSSFGDINIFIDGGINPEGSSIEELAERLGFEFEQQIRTSTGV